MVDDKKKLLDTLKKISDQLQGYWDELDDISNVDRNYSEMLDDIQAQHPEKKLKKSEKKELFAKMLDKELPDLVKTLNEFDLLSEAIGDRVEQTKDKLQDKIDSLDEIEDLEQELEDRKRELDI